jgi:hypothetical protein
MPRHQFGANSSSRKRHWPVLFAFIALASLVSGCSKSGSEPERKVYGLYQIGKTTPADVGVCRPQNDQTYCSNNPSPKIAGHRTQTDLFFRGHEDTAPLVEILTGIWSCRPGQISADLHAMIGEPTKTADKRAYWKLDEMTVVALLPKDNDLCTVHFLDHSETERIAELYPGL